MKRKLTLTIVDDEQAAIDRMLALLAPFVDLLVKATFTDPKAALEYLDKNHVDFVILDMEMPIITGKAFILQMPKEINVLLCTGHSVYATDGLDRKSTRLNSSHVKISYAVFCMNKKTRLTFR